MSIEYKNAFMNLMRKHITDPAQRESTTKTETFTIVGDEDYLELANSSIICVEEVTVNNVLQQIVRDYEVYFGKAHKENGRIYFKRDLSPDDVVTVKYSHGVNWVFFGYPQVAAKMPRIGMMARDGKLTPAGFGDVEHFSNPIINIVIVIRSGVEYVIDGKGYSGERLLDFLTNEVRKAIINIRRNAEMGFLITMDYSGDEQMTFEEEPDLIAKSIVVTGKFQWNYP